MPRIFVSDKLQAGGLDLLQKSGVDLDNRPGLTGDALKDALRNAEGMIVRSDTKVTAELLENPGKLKASGTGQGGIWHLALVGWMQAMGLAPNHVAWVPSNGAAPAMQDLAAGGLDLTTCSVPEGRAMIEAGKARSLAIMAKERNPSFPTVPTLKEEMGIDYSTGAWRGFAAPKGLPPEIARTYETAIKKAWDSDEFKDFMTRRGFDMIYQDAAKYGEFMKADDEDNGKALKSLGLAK